MNPIARICCDRNLSKAKFSSKARIPYTTVLHITRGLSRTMKPKTAQAIAEFANEDPEKIRKEYQEFYKG